MDTATLVAVPSAPEAAAIGVRRLALAHIGVAVAAFGVAVGDGDDAGAVASQPRAAVPKRLDVLHVGHRPRHADGARLHDLLHHGLRLRRRRARARARGAVSVACVGVVLGRRRRHAGNRRGDSGLQGDGALYVLPAAPGASSLLHRLDDGRRRLMGMVGGDAAVVAGVAKAATPDGPFLWRCTASWRRSSSGCWPRPASPPRCCSC